MDAICDYSRITGSVPYATIVEKRTYVRVFFYCATLGTATRKPLTPLDAAQNFRSDDGLGRLLGTNGTKSQRHKLRKKFSLCTYFFLVTILVVIGRR